METRSTQSGHLKGLKQLKRMVKPGGIFYLSTQIGQQRIEFNAHRVFAPETMLEWFSDGWTIERCAVIDDDCNVSEGEGSERLRTSAVPDGSRHRGGEEGPVGRLCLRCSVFRCFGKTVRR